MAWNCCPQKPNPVGDPVGHHHSRPGSHGTNSLSTVHRQWTRQERRNPVSKKWGKWRCRLRFFDSDSQDLDGQLAGCLVGCWLAVTRWQLTCLRLLSSSSPKSIHGAPGRFNATESCWIHNLECPMEIQLVVLLDFRLLLAAESEFDSCFPSFLFKLFESLATLVVSSHVLRSYG